MNKIVIELETENEHESPGYFDKYTCSVGHEKEAVRKMKKKAVGEWGWCTAAVTVKVIDQHKNVDEETEYLGCCSYLSAVDFVKNSGYFNDMVREALDKIFRNRKMNL